MMETQPLSHSACWVYRNILAAVLLAAVMSGVAIAATVLDRPINAIETDLERLLGCKWQGVDPPVVCPLTQTGGVIILFRDLVGETVETVEFNALVAANPNPQPQKERLSRETVLQIVGYFLPAWKEGPAWMKRALDDATIEGAQNVVAFDGVKILVQWLQPATLQDTYARVVITKRASLEQWELHSD